MKANECVYKIKSSIIVLFILLVLFFLVGGCLLIWVAMRESEWLVGGVGVGGLLLACYLCSMLKVEYRLAGDAIGIKYLIPLFNKTYELDDVGYWITDTTFFRYAGVGVGSVEFEVIDLVKDQKVVCKIPMTHLACPQEFAQSLPWSYRGYYRGFKFFNRINERNLIMPDSKTDEVLLKDIPEEKQPEIEIHVFPPYEDDGVHEMKEEDEDLI